MSKRLNFRVVEDTTDYVYEVIKEKVAKHEEFTDKELAEKLDMSPRAISKRYLRACEELNVKPYRKQTGRPIRNYHFTNGHYNVSKCVDGKRTYFACVKTEEEAKKIVEKLKACNWDKAQLSRIKREVIVEAVHEQ